MKYVLAPLFVSSFFALTSAQDVNLTFGAPTQGQQVSPGGNLEVTLIQSRMSDLDTNRPGFISIDLISCQGSGGCPDPSNSSDDGPNLYNGPYSPEAGQDGSCSQTFALQIPPNVVTGNFLLAVNGVISVPFFPPQAINNGESKSIGVEIQVVLPPAPA